MEPEEPHTLSESQKQLINIALLNTFTEKFDCF